MPCEVWCTLELKESGWHRSHWSPPRQTVMSLGEPSFILLMYHNTSRTTILIVGVFKRKWDGIIQIIVLHQSWISHLYTFEHFLNWVWNVQHELDFPTDGHHLLCYTISLYFRWLVSHLSGVCSEVTSLLVRGNTYSVFGERRAAFQGTTENCGVTLPASV